MSHIPTWHGEPISQDTIIATTREGFELLVSFMTGSGVRGYSKDELLHITEAATLVGAMSDYANATALPLAKVRGASLGELSAVTGLPRSTLQTKKYKDMYADWADFEARV